MPKEDSDSGDLFTDEQWENYYAAFIFDRLPTDLQEAILAGCSPKVEQDLAQGWDMADKMAGK